MIVLSALPPFACHCHVTPTLTPPRHEKITRIVNFIPQQETATYTYHFAPHCSDPLLSNGETQNRVHGLPEAAAGAAQQNLGFRGKQ